MKTSPILLGALTLAALSTVGARATTMNSLADFGGIEEPQVIWHVSSSSFTNDSFVNITNVTPGTFQSLLRWSSSQWDGDRTTSNNDRGRAEVKTLGDHQRVHQTFEYTTTWRTNPEFKGSGRFCHITQLKSVDGAEGSSGAPMITTSIGSGTSSAVVQYCSANFSPTNVFSPKPVRSVTWHPATWLAEKIRVTATADGEKGGQVVVSLNGDSFQGVTNVEVCRPSSTEYYPKWGLYRKQETSSGFSPADYIQHSNVSAGPAGSVSTPSTPVFSPGSGTYSSAQSVTITSSGATTINYTTDGSTPTSSSPVASGPIAISSTTTLKAIGTNSAGSSPVGTATYTITTPVTAAPVFSPAAGTYTDSVTVSLSSSTTGASINYTTDGSTPTSSSGTPYTGPITITTTTTIKAIAFASGFADSAVTSATYTIVPSGGGGTVSWEAESLTRTASGATASTDTDAAASGGARVTLNSTGTNQYVEFTLPNVAAGTYSVQLAYKTNNNRGILSLKVDGTQVGGTLDQYASSSSYPSHTFGTVTFASAGNHTLRLTVTGKNSASSSYTLSADKITLSSTTTPPPTITVEAESLTRTASGATASTDTDAAASGGARVTLNSTGTGQFVEFTLPNVPAGTYSVQMAYKTNANRGILSFKVDGTQVGSTLDQYASSSSYPTQTFGTVTFATAGSHALRLTVTGKNSASSSYTLSADKFTLVGQ